MCGRGADSFTSPLPSEPRGQRCRSASLPPSKPHGGGGNPTPGEVTAGDLGGHCARWQGAAQRRTDGHAVESVTCQSFVMEKLFFFFFFFFETLSRACDQQQMSRRNATKGCGRHWEGGELNEVTQEGVAEKQSDGLKSVIGWMWFPLSQNPPRPSKKVWKESRI